jgi:hypothetical protein
MTVCQRSMYSWFVSAALSKPFTFASVSSSGKISGFPASSGSSYCASSRAPFTGET